jgi:hypothetical protein
MVAKSRLKRDPPSRGNIPAKKTLRQASSLASKTFSKYKPLMPELSRFFGIIIRMYAEAGEPHHTAHFHAYCQDQVAVFGIDPIGIIAGDLSMRHRRLIEAWAELHQMNCW